MRSRPDTLHTSQTDIVARHCGIHAHSYQSHPAIPIFKKTDAQFTKLQGFTLIELLVVISILAAMATVSVSIIDGYDQKARAELVQVEMKTIAKAIYRFHRDTGYFPKTGIFATSAPTDPANLTMLFTAPQDNTGQLISPWDPSVAQGWHGPYLTPDSAQRLHTPSGVPAHSNCDLDVGIAAQLNNSNSFIALEDPFPHSLTFTGTSSCFAIRGNNGWLSKQYAGQPYQYLTTFTNNAYPDCTASTGCIALISSGPDGQFSNGNNDDVVRILRVNP